MLLKSARTPSALTMAYLMTHLRRLFSTFEDNREDNSSIPLPDALLSGMALFSLKDSSLLFFNNKRSARKHNLQSIYKINTAPSDTGMRAILDEVDPSQFGEVFTWFVKTLRKVGILRSYQYHKRFLIVAQDGVHHFSSYKVRCKHCLEYKVGDAMQYRHYTYSSALVHPDKKEVFPIWHEPILKSDGNEKNDCEQNAAKRAYPQLHAMFPREKILIVQDAIGSTGPNIKAIQKEDFSFLLGIKPASHQTLFKHFESRKQRGATKSYTTERDGFTHQFEYALKMPLNDSHGDIRVNFLDYRQIDKTGKKPERHFTWITDLHLNKRSLYKVMRAGRSRWKIENETFNTLKNQGYHFEHNFGHGENHLNVVFMYLMMLAFFVDQLQQGCNEFFQLAWKKTQTKKALWEEVRKKFDEYEVPSMNFIYELIIGTIQVRCTYYRPNNVPFGEAVPHFEDSG